MANVGKIIQISALGADNNAFTNYHLSKKAADDYLSRLNIDWVILQPSIVYGPGAKSMRLFQALATLPFTPLVDSGDQKIQPIHIDDLTKAIMATIDDNSIHHQRIAAVGAEPITMKTLFNGLKQRLDGTPARFIKIPGRLVTSAAQLAGLLSNCLITADAVKMLRLGNTASVQPFITAFAFKPRSVQQALFRNPPLQSEKLDAKLYFLVPLLKYSLALLWISTGLISMFGYPTVSSYAMLQQVSIPTYLMPITLYGASLLDIALGVAMFISYQLRLVLLAQILTIITYSIIISFGLPELWLHPFGPVTKNIPLLVVTWMLLRLDR